MLSTEGIYMKKATIYFTLWRRVFASNLIILTFIVKHLTPARISLHLNFMTHAHTTHTLKNEYLLGNKKNFEKLRAAHSHWSFFSSPASDAHFFHHMQHTHIYNGSNEDCCLYWYSYQKKNLVLLNSFGHFVVWGGWQAEMLGIRLRKRKKSVLEDEDFSWHKKGGGGGAYVWYSEGIWNCDVEWCRMRRGRTKAALLFACTLERLSSS